jgi:hypothetical protein
VAEVESGVRVKIREEQAIAIERVQPEIKAERERSKSASDDEIERVRAGAADNMSRAVSLLVSRATEGLLD